jgi:hypothetical protein
MVDSRGNSSCRSKDTAAEVSFVALEFPKRAFSAGRALFSTEPEGGANKPSSEEAPSGTAGPSVGFVVSPFGIPTIVDAL